MWRLEKGKKTVCFFVCFWFNLQFTEIHASLSVSGEIKITPRFGSGITGLTDLARFLSAGVMTNCVSNNHQLMIILSTYERY